MDPTANPASPPDPASSGETTRVQVSFYGHLTSLVGGRTRSVELSGERPTVGDLRDAIRQQVPEVASHLDGVAVGVGTELARDDRPLDPTQDREISLLPPVSGG